MDFKKYFQDLALYHKWAYEKLNASITEISDSDYRKNCGLFFGSMHGTLNHLCVADTLWYNRFAHMPNSLNLEDELYTDRAALIEALLKRADLWIHFLSTHFPKDHPPKTLSYRNTKGLDITVPYLQALAHVFNHGTHHRGQISAVVTQLGFKAPEMDLYYYLRESQQE